MKVAITGSSGLVGTALTTFLRSRGDEVTAVVRSEPQAGEIRWNPATHEIEPNDFVGVDAVIHLAGAGIGERRWNAKYKQIIEQSRTDGTDLLSRALAGLENGPHTIISGSAVGYYGDRGQERLTESSMPGEGFLPSLCVKWEAAMDPARSAGLRVATIRTGIVLTPGGGALAKMLPLFKVGLGGRFGHGHQIMPWISLTDHVRAVGHLLSTTTEGPVNLTGPAPVSNREFTETLGRVLKRPTLLPVPAFAPKMLLGAEMAQALLFDSTNAVPAALIDDGFEFTHPSLEAALRAELDRAG